MLLSFKLKRRQAGVNLSVNLSIVPSWPQRSQSDPQLLPSHRLTITPKLSPSHPISRHVTQTLNTSPPNSHHLNQTLTITHNLSSSHPNFHDLSKTLTISPKHPNSHHLTKLSPSHSNSHHLTQTLTISSKLSPSHTNSPSHPNSHDLTQKFTMSPACYLEVSTFVNIYLIYVLLLMYHCRWKTLFTARDRESNFRVYVALYKTNNGRVKG